MIHCASKGKCCVPPGFLKRGKTCVSGNIIHVKSSSLFCSRDIKYCLNCDSIEDALLKHRNYLSFYSNFNYMSIHVHFGLYDKNCRFSATNNKT